MSLFEHGSVIRPVDFGDAGSGSETSEEQQAFAAVEQQRALTNVKRLKETAWYVARMPGGVRGGGREASLYSIACAWQTDIYPGSNDAVFDCHNVHG
jgi:hypothetical protein